MMIQCLGNGVPRASKACLLLVFAGLLGLLGAGPSQAPLPEGFRLVLPRGLGIAGEWVIPPSQVKDTKGSLDFNVHPDGTVWLALGERVLYAPQHNAMVVVDRPFQQFLWLKNNDQLARSGEALGTLKTSPALKKGRPALRFKPLIMMPYQKWRIFPAGPDNLLIVGYHPGKKVYQLSLLGPQADSRRASPLKVIYETESEITAAAGMGQNIYFAVERTVFQLFRSQGKTQAVYVHPDGEIRELAYVPGGGLFYATNKSVGFIGQREQFDFLRQSGCSIRLSGDSLYVLFGDIRQGLMRIRNVKRFAQASLGAD